jgi:type VI secretion system ImpM family protein
MPNPTGAGFFGKLPGVGDFVQRRLPMRFVDCWDQHFEHAVDAARAALGSDWPAAYHASPIWRFAMPAGICGDSAWVGVLGPSSDRVGRCFPMVITAPLDRREAVTQVLLEGDHWFDTLARVHARAQADPSIHAEAFDGQVAAAPGPGGSNPIAAPQPPQPLDWRSASHWRFPLAQGAAGAAQLAGLWSQLAPAGWCLWWTAGAARVPPTLLATRGLPQPAAYAAFLDVAHAGAPWQSAGDFNRDVDAEVTQNRRIAFPPAPAIGPMDAPPVAAPRTLLPDDLSELFADLAMTPVAPPDALSIRLGDVLEEGAVRYRADATLTLVAADDGLRDPRRQAAAVAHALVDELDIAELAGGVGVLRQRLLASHAPLRRRGEDLLDPVCEDGAVVAAQLNHGHAAVLRIGSAGVWHYRRGQLHALFAAGEAAADDESLGGGGEFDDLLFGRVTAAAPGLGAARGPLCEEAACTVATGDRLLLMATQALVQLSPPLLAEALALPSVGDARARIAAAAGFRAPPIHWPLAIIEITP